MSDKPNCYACKHRRDVPGDAHSQCVHPHVAGTGLEVMAMCVITKKGGVIVNDVTVRGNPHGINEGWFCWPLNFDPVWLEECTGFEEIAAAMRADKRSDAL